MVTVDDRACEGLLPAGVGPDGPLNLGAGFAVERVRGLWLRSAEQCRFMLALLYKLTFIDLARAPRLDTSMIRLFIEGLADGTLIKETPDGQ